MSITIPDTTLLRCSGPGELRHLILPKCIYIMAWLKSGHHYLGSNVIANKESKSSGSTTLVSEPTMFGDGKYRIQRQCTRTEANTRSCPQTNRYTKTHISNLGLSVWISKQFCRYIFVLDLQQNHRKTIKYTKFLCIIIKSFIG